MKALLQAIEDQMQDVLGRLRASIPAQEWLYPEGFVPGREAFPEGEGVPREYHESSQDIHSPAQPWGQAIGVRWWPQLDEFHRLLRRVQTYKASL